MIPKPSACIIDATALLCEIRVEKKTFSYLTEIIFASALKDGTSSDRIHIICNVYKDINRLMRVMTDEFLGSILFGQNILSWRWIIGCLGVNPPVVKDFPRLTKNKYHPFLNCLHHKRKWISDYFACKVAIVVWWHGWLFREMGNIYVRCGSQVWTRHIDISNQGM